MIGLIAGFLFGIATPISKLALAYLNSFQLAGLLYLGSSFFFLPYFLKNGNRDLSVIKKKPNRVLVFGIVLFGGFLGPIFLMVGLKSANAMSVSIWLNVELIATALIGFFFFKEHLGKFAVLGILFTLTSSIIISSQENISGLLSGMFVTAACLCWAVDNHLTAIIDGVTPQSTTFIKGAAGGTTNLAIGLFLSGGKIGFEYIFFAVLLGMFSYGVSIFLYILSAQSLGATRSQILFSTSPFWGIALAWFLLDEPINPILILALSFLVAGIVCSHLSSHSHPHTHQAITHIHLHRHDDGHHDHPHAEKDKTAKHVHVHTHATKEHSHDHYPDLHHRHDHKRD